MYHCMNMTLYSKHLLQVRLNKGMVVAVGHYCMPAGAVAPLCHELDHFQDLSEMQIHITLNTQTIDHIIVCDNHQVIEKCLD